MSTKQNKKRNRENQKKVEKLEVEVYGIKASGEPLLHYSFCYCLHVLLICSHSSRLHKCLPTTEQFKLSLKYTLTVHAVLICCSWLKKPPRVLQ